jgi:hypothetical protein
MASSAKLTQPLTLNGGDAVAEVYKTRFLENWSTLTNLRKPIIAAVSGYAVRIRSVSRTLSSLILSTNYLDSLVEDAN